MCRDSPVFDRSKPFSSYVFLRKSRFCISCDDLGDYWISCISEDYPSYLIGPYSKSNSIKCLFDIINNFNRLEAVKNEKRV